MSWSEASPATSLAWLDAAGLTRDSCVLDVGGGDSHLVDRVLATLKPGGSAIIATSALDGPEKCSGLSVQRYSPETLAVELGLRFALVDASQHVHTTPWGSTQSFQHSWLRRVE